MSEHLWLRPDGRPGGTLDTGHHGDVVQVGPMRAGYVALAIPRRYVELSPNHRVALAALILDGLAIYEATRELPLLVDTRVGGMFYALRTYGGIVPGETLVIGAQN